MSRISAVTRTGDGFRFQNLETGQVYEMHEGIQMARVNQAVAETARPNTPTVAEVTTPEVSKPKKVRKPTKVLSAVNTLFVIGPEGIIAANKKNGQIVPIGYIDPEDFYRCLTISPSLETEILTKNVIWYKKSTTAGLTVYNILMQFDPQVLSLKLRSNNDPSGYITKSLAMPYIQFLFTIKMVEGQAAIQKALIGCSTKPVKSLSDTLYQLPTNNIWPDGRICWGIGNSVPSEKLSPFEYSQKLVTKFFTSPFNNDLAPKAVDGIDGYEDWGTKTVANPLFVLTDVRYNVLGKIDTLFGL